MAVLCVRVRCRDVPSWALRAGGLRVRVRCPGPYVRVASLSKMKLGTNAFILSAYKNMDEAITVIANMNEDEKEQSEELELIRKYFSMLLDA